MTKAPTETSTETPSETSTETPAETSTETEPAHASHATADVASYELAKDELATVVARLESGGLSLDESLALWERGEHLAAVCNRFLDGARERVETALAAAHDPD